MYVSANANARSSTSTEAVARVLTPRRAHDATRGSETCVRDLPRNEHGGATARAAADALIEVARKGFGGGVAFSGTGDKE